MKLTDKDKAERILDEGKVIKIIPSLKETDTVIVDAFGQRYRIENAYGKKPKITQYLHQCLSCQNLDKCSIKGPITRTGTCDEYKRSDSDGKN